MTNRNQARWLTLSQQYCSPAPQPRPARADDLRLGHLLRKGDDEQAPAVAILGFPSDEGVARNGGRRGAVEGPTAVRERLYKLTPDPRESAMSDLLGRCVDLGNVQYPDSLAGHQARLGEIIGALLEDGIVPIVIGGGHETAFGHFCGYAANQQPVDIINLDAHADVRPLVDGLGHSGSPFRQAMEHPSGCLRHYSVLGLQPTSVAANHLDYLHSNDAELCFAEQLDLDRIRSTYRGARRATYATFCLDVLDQSLAPGVSAPSADGIDRRQWDTAIVEAARNPAISSFDIVELAPELDRDEQTARLAAHSIWLILRELACHRRL